MQTLQASLTTAHQSSIPNPNLNPSIIGQNAAANIQSVIDSTVDLVEPYADSGKTAKGETLPPALHVVTPLVYSEVLSGKHDVYLKMDCLQPSASFKIRGIGAVCQQAYEQHGPKTYIITSSGGNAGLAAATAAKTLAVKCLVIVPRRTEPFVVQMLQDLGAEVDNKTADVWDDADRMAREIIARDPDATYVHPFEGDVLTAGHATLVEELRLQLAEAGVKGSRPDMIVCSVGGGGLIRGIIQGVHTTKDKHPEFGTPKIVSVQDFGADSFSKSFNAWLASGGEPKVVSIPAITSKATSMGTKSCSAETLQVACQYSGDESTRKSRMATLVVDDAISGSACWQFYRDHQLMVEMACGAALAPVYQPRILDELVRGLGGPEGERKTIVIVVCGGSKVDADTLKTYERDYGKAEDDKVKAMIDGQYI